jgi:adenylate cyclase
MSKNPNRLVNFWQELKRRRVIHVIIVYATAAFVIIELINNVYETLNLPDWTPAMTLVILIIGFPIVIIISWIFDITPKGLKKTNPVELTKNNKKGHPPSDKISRFENSIAVLPFQDMSPQKDQEYFCDGMTEEIINALAHVGSLKVIARTSAYAFKDKHEDMREIGNKLDVETLLEGSIRKDRNHLRITAQLINVVDGSHLWSDAYNRELEDVFAIQEEISLAIVDKLKVKLLGQENEALVKRHTENLEAYNLFLKGNYYWQMMTTEGFKKASECYELALQKDPYYSLAYSWLAATYMTSTTYGSVPPNEAYPKAKEYTKKALEIDCTLADAHITSGCLSIDYDWNWKTAEQEYKLALKLNPNSAAAHLTYSWFLTFTDHINQAIAEAERALELDPLSGYYNTMLGHAYLYARQYDRAIEKLQWTITMYPNYHLAHTHLGMAYKGKLMIKEAIEEFEKAVNLSRGTPLVVSYLACAYYELGKKEQAEKLIDSLEQRLKNEYVPSTCFVPYHIIRSDYDQAFKWLERAINEHDSNLNWFIVEAIGKYRIPDEPRYNALLEKVGLEKYQQQLFT